MFREESVTANVEQKSGAATASKILESADPPRSIVMLEARELWYVVFCAAARVIR